MDTALHVRESLPTQLINHPHLLNYFHYWTKKTPNQTALLYGNKTLTYHELDQRTHQLATILQTRYSATNPPWIAVLLPHSLELAVSLIGILKAGAAYIPLDPHYPAHRLNHIFDNAKPLLLITLSTVSLDWLPKNSTNIIDIIKVDTLDLRVDASPIPPNSKTSLAYVIYTSGSTGTPKGVKVNTLSLTHCLDTIQTRIPLSPSDRFFALTPISFDIFGLELFWPLMQGACCILNDNSIRFDPTQLANALEDTRATVMQATPATWTMLAQSTTWKNSHLRHLLCGGEAWDIGLAHTLLSKVHPEAQLWNLYGPTETTIWCACQKVSIETQTITLGSPLSGNHFYLLNEANELADEGELCISGANLAEGYTSHTETEKKFTNNPFASLDGNDVLYHTGDHVKRLQNNYYYLGRFDRQIKIRGFRVELGEIEAILQQHPSVLRAAVIAEQNTETCLTAYLVLTSDNIDTDDIRYYLNEHLPSYMIPQHFKKRSQLPLTPAGKTDYIALKNSI